MKKLQGGSVNLILIVVIVVLVGVVGYFVLVKKSTVPVTQESTPATFPTPPAPQPVSPTAPNKNFTVTFPKAGDTLIEGQTYNINWSNPTNSTSTSYGLYLENDQVGSIRIGETSQISFSWKVPSILFYMNGGDSLHSTAPEDGYRISFTSTDDGKAKYFSSIFKITPKTQPSITLLYPNGGENWKIGQKYNISFTTTANLGPLTIGLVRYSDDSVAIGSTIIGTSSTKSFAYNVPTGIETTNGRAGRYKIEVYPAGGRELVVRSKDYFSITN